MTWPFPQLHFPAESRLRNARAVLIVAVVLLGIAHLMPLVGEHDGTFQSELYPMWGFLWLDVQLLASGNFDPAEMIGVLVVGLVLLVLALPWIAGMLTRARPLRWVVRVILICPTLWLWWEDSRIHSPSPDPALRTAFAALVLACLGTLILPRMEANPPEQPAP